MTETSQITTEGGRETWRIFFLPHNPYDARTARELFAEYNLTVITVDDLSDLVDEVGYSADCLLIAEEGLRTTDYHRLIASLQDQPEWSDLPVIIATRGDSSSKRAWRLMQDANVTLVERPLHIKTLVSLIRAALRDRARQYQLRQSIINRDRFLSMVGHELRNPLTSIKLALDLLNSTDNPALEIIENQYRTLERIVDDIRDLGQISQGVVTFDKTRLDLVDIVQDTIDAFASIAKREGLELHQDLPDLPLWVQGDPVRLGQVLGNLLSNAIRYTPEGGVIEVQAQRLSELAAVIVRDSGIGIPPEKLDNIFDLFTRVQSDRPMGKEGLGLGLNLAHSIVNAHDGQLIAESEGPGKGSEFSFYLPLSDPPPEYTDEPRLSPP